MEITDEALENIILGARMEGHSLGFLAGQEAMRGRCVSASKQAQLPEHYR